MEKLLFLIGILFFVNSALGAQYHPLLIKFKSTNLNTKMSTLEITYDRNGELGSKAYVKAVGIFSKNDLSKVNYELERILSEANAVKDDALAKNQMVEVNFSPLGLEEEIDVSAITEEERQRLTSIIKRVKHRYNERLKKVLAEGKMADAVSEYKSYMECPRCRSKDLKYFASVVFDQSDEENINLGDKVLTFSMLDFMKIKNNEVKKNEDITRIPSSNSSGLSGLGSLASSLLNFSFGSKSRDKEGEKGEESEKANEVLVLKESNNLSIYQKTKILDKLVKRRIGEIYLTHLKGIIGEDIVKPSTDKINQMAYIIHGEEGKEVIGLSIDVLNAISASVESF